MVHVLGSGLGREIRVLKPVWVCRLLINCNFVVVVYDHFVAACKRVLHGLFFMRIDTRFGGVVCER